MINRNNYEEYFLLLADKELSPEEEAMVKQFAAKHPDLQEELDIILSCTLDAEPMPVFPKEKLFRTTIWNEENPAPVQTQMLLLLDNELPPAAQTQLQAEIAASATLQKEWSTLQQTKLLAEAIAHPDKESLYRNERKIRPLVWMRWAAAAAVIFGSTWTFWPAANSNQSATETVAKTDLPVQQTTPKTTPTVSSSSPVNTTNSTVATTVNDQPATAVNEEVNQQAVAVENRKQKHTTTVDKYTTSDAPKATVYTASATTQNNFSKENTEGSNQIATTTLHNTDANLDPMATNQNLVVQTAHLTPKAIALPTNNVAKPSDVFTGKTASVMSDEEEEYITVGGAKIRKQKMRGLFRSVSRSVGRSLSKSKLEPDVYATR